MNTMLKEILAIVPGLLLLAPAIGQSAPVTKPEDNPLYLLQAVQNARNAAGANSQTRQSPAQQALFPYFVQQGTLGQLVSGPQGCSISFEAGGKQVEITLRDQRLQASVDGKPVMKANLGHEPLSVELNGNKLATVSPLPENVVGGKRAQLGVNVRDLDEPLASHLGLQPGQAVIVLSVTKGQAADTAGILKHDIVTRINGEGQVTQQSLTATIAKKKPNDRIKLTLVRQGKEREVTVKLGRDLVSNFYVRGRVGRTLHPFVDPYITTQGIWTPLPDPQVGHAKSDSDLQAEIDKLRGELGKLEKLIDALNKMKRDDK